MSAPTAPLERSAAAPAVGRVLPLVALLATAVGVVLRFWPRRDMWLDEALSVNISSLPLGEIPDALRHDGHPPLYYFLLHLWLRLGSSDWWVRALSGVIGLVGFPLAYLAGRRLGRRRGTEGMGGRRIGLIALALWAVLPFAVRYGSETRMYALVSAVVLAGYLLVDNLLAEPRRPDRPGPPARSSAVGLAFVTGALLLSHYWTLWLGASTALLAVVVLVRSSDPDRRRRAMLCMAGLVGGLLLFSWWVPAMVFQSQHTGTPWGEVFRPATIVVVTLTDLVGGGFGELQIMSYLLFAVIALAVFGALRRRAGREVVEITAVPQSRVLAEVSVLLGTLMIGWAASAASSATYASRYAAVVAPLFALSVAGGLGMARSARATTVLVSLTCAALVVGGVVEITTDRTQAGVAAGAISQDLVATGHQEAVDGTDGGDGQVMVLTCPDQLAPATHRALRHRGVEADVVPFPDPTGDPRFVDWVDYGERNRGAEPAEFAAAFDDLDPDTPLYVVANTGYLTLEGKCEGLLGALATEGFPLEQLITADPDNFFESMSLWARRPTP